MSMKSLPHKHHCPKQNCRGNAKDYDNYLVALNKTKPKIKSSKTARSYNSLHQKAQKQNKPKGPKSKPSKQISERSEVQDLKKRNQELEYQLQEKSKRINQMKQKIKDYQGKIKNYQNRISQLQSIINQSQYPKSPISLQKPTETMMNHYQQQLRLVQTSQKATIQAMDKYHLLQKSFNDYRNESQRKIQRLIRQNQQLRHFESDDRTYDEEINSLRKQLHRLSQHSPIKHESFTFQQDLITLKANNKQLMIEKENLCYQLKEKEQCINSLRRNLQAINSKVDRWNQQYRKMIEQKRMLEQKYNAIVNKLQIKKQKQIRQKEQWASIFRELVRQVQKLKRQINKLQRGNQQRIHNNQSQDQQ